MLRRLLFILTAMSLLLAVAVGVLWIVSAHHAVTHNFGGDPIQWNLSAEHGVVFVTKVQNIGGMILTSSVPYPMKRLLTALLLVPLVAVLIEIRRRLPRPGVRR